MPQPRCSSHYVLAVAAGLALLLLLLLATGLGPGTTAEDQKPAFRLQLHDKAAGADSYGGAWGLLVSSRAQRGDVWFRTAFLAAERRLTPAPPFPGAV